VLAVGDAEFQKKCLGKMQEVSRGGRTVLFVSHNMSAVARLCGKAILLDGGRLKNHGDSKIVLFEYQTVSGNRGTQTISTRRDRNGSGKIRIQDVSILDESGSCLHVISNSKPIIIRLKYLAFDDLKKIDFVVSVRTLADERLFVCTSNHNAGPFQINKGLGQIDCQLDTVPLSPGIYTINIAAQFHQEIFDWVSNVLTFEVIDSDYYGNGSNSHLGHSPFLVRSKWLLSPISSDQTTEILDFSTE
jgi:lipopolysaccharide transport system ATP-binding protein